MDDIKQTIGALRENMTKQLEAGVGHPHLSDIGARVREQVVRLLKRTDLRIAPEIVLNDLRNSFTRYETLEPEFQRRAVEDALQIIEKMEALVVSETVLNPDRIELPAPPPSMAKVTSEVERIQRDERRRKDNLQKEANAQLSDLRPGRTQRRQSPGDEKRRNLAFSDGRGGDAKRRGGQSRNTAGKSPGAKQTGGKPTGGKPSGGGRSRRPRRRK